MTKFKTILLTGAVIFGLGITTTTSLAAMNYKTPAEIVAEITGNTVDSVIETKVDTGKTYGTIANEAGKLEEFQEEMLQSKKEYLDELVKEGKITQEKADEIIKAIEENQATCDGTGSARIGQKYGVGFGSGTNDTRRGNGGRGNGRGMGQRGMQLRDGSCALITQ